MIPPKIYLARADSGIRAIAVVAYAPHDHTLPSRPCCIYFAGFYFIRNKWGNPLPLCPIPYILIYTLFNE